VNIVVVAVVVAVVAVLAAVGSVGSEVVCSNSGSSGHGSSTATLSRHFVEAVILPTTGVSYCIARQLHLLHTTR
jgi:hypothetical protein